MATPQHKPVATAIALIGIIPKNSHQFLAVGLSRFGDKNFCDIEVLDRDDDGNPNRRLHGISMPMHILREMVALLTKALAEAEARDFL